MRVTGYWELIPFFLALRTAPVAALRMKPCRSSESLIHLATGASWARDLQPGATSPRDDGETTGCEVARSKHGAKSKSRSGNVAPKRKPNRNGLHPTCGGLHLIAMAQPKNIWMTQLDTVAWGWWQWSLPKRQKQPPPPASAASGAPGASTPAHHPRKASRPRRRRPPGTHSPRSFQGQGPVVQQGE